VVFTVSAALLFGVVLFFLLRSRALGAGSALIAVLFGFYLASTGIAPTVNHTISALLGTLARIH